MSENIEEMNSTFSGFGIDKLLKTEIISGIFVWQALFIICTILFIFLVLLCCCISFRIPRTKQEIEADYIRNQITRKFRKQLNLIQDSEMDEMDLFKAIEKVRFEFMSNEEKAVILMKSNDEKYFELEKENAGKPEPETETYDKTSVNYKVLHNGTSEDKVMNRGNSVFSNKLITIVNAFTVMRSKKSVDVKSKQMTV